MLLITVPSDKLMWQGSRFPRTCPCLITERTGNNCFLKSLISRERPLQRIRLSTQFHCFLLLLLCSELSHWDQINFLPFMCKLPGNSCFNPVRTNTFFKITKPCGIYVFKMERREERGKERGEGWEEHLNQAIDAAPSVHAPQCTEVDDVTGACGHRGSESHVPYTLSISSWGVWLGCRKMCVFHTRAIRQTNYFIWCSTKETAICSQLERKIGWTGILIGGTVW